MFKVNTLLELYRISPTYLLNFSIINFNGIRKFGQINRHEGRGYFRLHNLQPENPYETVQIVIASKTFRFFRLHKNVEMKKFFCLELSKLMANLQFQYFSAERCRFLDRCLVFFCPARFCGAANFFGNWRGLNI